MQTQTEMTKSIKGVPGADTLQVMRKLRDRRVLAAISHTVALILSLALIVFISYDTFEGIQFLSDRIYMTFQFWVCVVFLIDFFLELFLSERKGHYLLTHWFFFVISIPYLNLIDVGQWNLTPETIYYLSFVPLVRGAYSLAMVAGYISANRATSLVVSYAAILVSIVYFASLIFYRQEGTVNSDVTSYWDALWWACMNVTTIGCYINPMTPAGMICGVVLAASGMLMLPLFTAMVVNLVKAYNDKQRQRMAALDHSLAAEIRARRKTDPGFMKEVSIPAATSTTPPSPEDAG